MKFITLTASGIRTFFITPEDSRQISARCQQAGKQWASGLLGFFVNMTTPAPYAAVTIQTGDGAIECMEYIDVDRQTPEFSPSDALLQFLNTQTDGSELPLREFESLFNEILLAPMKARRWEVYPVINQQYQATH